MSTQHLNVQTLGRDWTIEIAWSGSSAAPQTLVLLHEGLGSVAAWRDFPSRLAAACGARVLSYSRPGYGQSTPRAPDEHWAADFMHRQALQLLPAVLDALGLHAPVHLIGHSDGGSIALLAAAQRAQRVASCVVMAPHTHVEALTLRSIEGARRSFEATNGRLRHRLSRYHRDVDSAFLGWAQAWLSPDFRHWNIEAETAAIACPLLAIQGLNDEYGSLEQVRGVQRRTPHAQILELPDCGHWPQRDRLEAVLDALQRFYSG